MTSLSFSRYAPKKQLLPSAWAEANVLVPAGNARPGRISFLEAPFQRGMLDICVDSKINRISLMTGAQIGKTMIALCLLGFFTEHQPMSQILMQPTQTDMKKWLEGKFDPMVAANPRLQKLYAKPRGREGANNSIMKTFRGGHLILAWAGSPNTTRGVSAPVIICDEVDAYEYTEEGHPANLLWQRAATFGDRRKFIEMSTPTIKHKSRIENSFYQGDQRQFFVICPHCSEKHTLAWENVRYDAEDVSTALIHCPKCDHGFNDTERISLVRYAEADGGGWAPSAPTRGHASFHLPVFYSPLRRLGDIVENYLAAEKDNSLETFFNTCLGETYEQTGDTAEEHELAARVEDYPAEVPKGVKILTMGVDVQKDRLEAEVVGWGTSEERWHIAYEVFHGDTSDRKSPCYTDLMKFAARGFEYEGGGRMFVEGLGIDSGYNTLVIYDFVKRWSRRVPRVFALKGVGGWNREVLRASRPQRTYRGVRPALYTIAVDIAKQVLMKRLNIEKPGPGYCHFPVERATGEYFKQLTSEVLLFDPRTNKRRWTKKDDGDNEALDCAIYAYTALHILHPDLDANVRHGLRGKGHPVVAKRQQKTWKNTWK